MAERRTVQRVLNQILMAYPAQSAKLSDSMIAGMIETWADHLSDVNDDMLAAAVRNHIDNSQWLPSIAEIRAGTVALMRQASPAHQIASEAWGDVKRAILTVGYYSKPTFANPVTAAIVQRMSWREICLDDGPEGVIRAQFERMYDAELARRETAAQQSPEVRQFVAAMTASGNDLLPPPERGNDAQVLIKRLGEAKRV